MPATTKWHLKATEHPWEIHGCSKVVVLTAKKCLVSNCKVLTISSANTPRLACCFRDVDGWCRTELKRIWVVRVFLKTTHVLTNITCTKEKNTSTPVDSITDYLELTKYNPCYKYLEPLENSTQAIYHTHFLMHHDIFVKMHV